MQPQYLKLNELLQNRIFTVPEYQRPYSWESAQRQDLFEDIQKLMDKRDQSHHFMATVVAMNPGKLIPISINEFNQIDLVDGQQRITSLVILLNEIATTLAASNEATEKSAGDELKKLLVKQDNNTILLQTNHDSSGLLTNYLRGEPQWNKTPETLAERNLRNAVNESAAISAKWSKENKILDALRVIQNRLAFLYYELDDEGLVYSTFEVLNSRGRPVEWLDKTKSMLMGIIYDRFPKAYATKFDESHRTWTKLYEIMGVKNISGDEILRFAATLRAEEQPSRTLSAEAAYARFRELAIEKPNQINTLMGFLVSTAESLKVLYDDSTRSTLTNIAQARLLYLSISASRILKDADKKLLLDLWEKVTFLVYGLARRDSRTCVGDFVRLAYSIYNDEKASVTDWINDLKAIANGFDLAAEVDALLKGRDCYTDWTNELRYFLFRYEQMLAADSKIRSNHLVWSDIWSSNATETIEHICPQTPSPEWVGALGKGRDVWVNNVNRLGNLILLPRGLNSEASNLPFREKRRLYKKANMLHHDEVIKVANWDRAAIEKRERGLRDFALKTWKI